MSIALRVAEVIEETSDARSLVFEGDLPSVPGQFLTIRVPHADGDLARCYSLASDPGAGEPMKVTVKRVADGRGSNWLCDYVAIGTELTVLPPSGTFTPRDLSEDVLLVAGGSGITPVMSILKAVVRSGGSVALFYANRDAASVIFAEELAVLASDRVQVTHWLESASGLPTSADIKAWAADFPGRQAFVCGPELFMSAAESGLADAGLAHREIHVERFTSLAGDPFAEPADAVTVSGPIEGQPAVEVTLDGETHEFAWPQETALLDLLLAAGLEAPYSCREGSCSACTCIVLEGEISMRANTVLTREDIEDGYALACQAVPLTDNVRISYEG